MWTLKKDIAEGCSGCVGFSLLHSLLIRRENILLKDVGGARKRQRMLPQRYFEEMSFMLRIHWALIKRVAIYTGSFYFSYMIYIYIYVYEVYWLLNNIFFRNWLNSLTYQHFLMWVETNHKCFLCFWDKCQYWDDDGLQAKPQRDTLEEKADKADMMKKRANKRIRQ